MGAAAHAGVSRDCASCRGCITQISAVPDKWDLHEGRAVTRQRQKMQVGEMKGLK